MAKLACCVMFATIAADERSALGEMSTQQEFTCCEHVPVGMLSCRDSTQQIAFTLCRLVLRCMVHAQQHLWAACRLEGQQCNYQDDFEGTSICTTARKTLVALRKLRTQ